MDSTPEKTTQSSKIIINKILGSSIFWWLLLTVIYFIIYYRAEAIFNDQQFKHIYQWPTDAITRFGQFIGIFVPIGPQNFLNILAYFGLPLLLLAGGLYLLEKKSKKYQINLMTKILGIFITLLMVTFVIDIITTGTWCSLIIFTSKTYQACPIHFKMF